MKIPTNQGNWLAGRTKGHANAAINAKATLAYIKDHPGIRSEDLQAALNHSTNIPMLTRHKLIYLRRKTIDGKQVTFYYPTNIQPPNRK